MCINSSAKDWKSDPQTKRKVVNEISLEMKASPSMKVFRRDIRTFSLLKNCFNTNTIDPSLHCTSLLKTFVPNLRKYCLY